MQKKNREIMSRGMMLNLNFVYALNFQTPYIFKEIRVGVYVPNYDKNINN